MDSNFAEIRDKLAAEVREEQRREHGQAILHGSGPDKPSGIRTVAYCRCSALREVPSLGCPVHGEAEWRRREESAAHGHDSRATGPLAGTGAGRTARKADTGAGFHPATRPISSAATVHLETDGA